MSQPRIDLLASPPLPRFGRALVVDLDGTLVRTDLVHEGALLYAKSSPLGFAASLVSLRGGRAGLKRRIGSAVTPSFHLLPFRREVLDLIEERRAMGHAIVLAASEALWANGVAEHLGMFDRVIICDGERNLAGAPKLEAIRAYCRENDIDAFDYVGGASVDLPIWRESGEIVVVDPSPVLLKRIREFREPERILRTPKPKRSPMVRALRPHQWVKNILVFVPLVTSHAIAQPSAFLPACVAFVSFSLTASAVYVLNDLLDIESDRRHHTKRERPFASGSLPIAAGAPIATACLIAGFTIAALALPGLFFATLSAYFAFTCLYSFYAKRIAMLDVLMLAGLYVIRVIAGGTAAGIVVSEWLMAFAMFLFVSLAFAKRFAELERLSRTKEQFASGRGYRVSDLSLIESMGTASGYLAVLVLALYVHGDEMKALYRHAWPLWLICAMLMYWISRIWIKATRGLLTEDPIVFALRDIPSLALGAASGILLAVASVI